MSAYAGHLTTVTLHGTLGKEFGRTWRLAVDKVGEAFRAIAAQRPGFRARIGAPGACWRVKRDDAFVDNRSVEIELRMPAGRHIRIIPVPQGCKSGIFSIILGVILIVFGVVLSIPSIGGSSALGAHIVIGVGISLALSGVASLFVSKPSTKETAVEHLPGDLFDGPANTAGQGVPVPVLYGRIVVRSVIRSPPPSSPANTAPRRQPLAAGLATSAATGRQVRSWSGRRDDSRTNRSARGAVGARLSSQPPPAADPDVLQRIETVSSTRFQCEM